MSENRSVGMLKRNMKREEIKEKSNIQKFYKDNVESKIIEEEKEITKEEKDTCKELFANIKKEPKVIYALLKDGIYPNEPNDQGDYPIHLAVIRDDALEMMKIFFDHKYKYKVKINAQNKNKETVLHLACKKAKSDLTNYLLEKGADPNIQDKDGNTCLHVISELSNQGVDVEEILDKCLTYGGNMEIRNNNRIKSKQLTRDTKTERLYMEHVFNTVEQVQGGDVEIGFSWKNYNDLDLHCYCNCGTQIFYSNKICGKCKGFLDYDMNVSLGGNLSSDTPVEHIFWPEIVPGKYKIHANFFKNHPKVELESEYLVTISIKGQCLFEKKGTLKFEKETQFVVEFEFEKDGNFKILNDKISTVNDSTNVNNTNVGRRERRYRERD